MLSFMHKPNGDNTLKSFYDYSVVFALPSDVKTVLAESIYMLYERYVKREAHTFEEF